MNTFSYSEICNLEIGIASRPMSLVLR